MRHRVELRQKPGHCSQGPSLDQILCSTGQSFQYMPWRRTAKAAPQHHSGRIMTSSWCLGGRARRQGLAGQPTRNRNNNLKGAVRLPVPRCVRVLAGTVLQSQSNQQSLKQRLRGRSVLEESPNPASQNSPLVRKNPPGLTRQLPTLHPLLSEGARGSRWRLRVGKLRSSTASRISQVQFVAAPSRRPGVLRKHTSQSLWGSPRGVGESPTKGGQGS